MDLVRSWWLTISPASNVASIMNSFWPYCTVYRVEKSTLGVDKLRRSASVSKSQQTYATAVFRDEFLAQFSIRYSQWYSERRYQLNLLLLLLKMMAANLMPMILARAVLNMYCYLNTDEIHNEINQLNFVIYFHFPHKNMWSSFVACITVWLDGESSLTGLFVICQIVGCLIFRASFCFKWPSSIPNFFGNNRVKPIECD